MADLNELALDLAVRVLGSPVYTALAIRRLVRNYLFMRMASAASIHCACGADLSLVGLWRCSCRFTYRGHLLTICPVCGTLPCIIRCYSCGVTTKLPEPE